MKILRLSLLCLTAGMFSIPSFAQQQVKISGIVKDRKSNTLLLSPFTASSRDTDKIISIPIKEGKFEYSLAVEHVEAYKLIFKDEMDNGAWRPIYFFPDTTAIKFELNPFDHFDKNIISGGQLNASSTELKALTIKKYGAIQAELDAKRDILNKADNYWSKEYNSTVAKLDGAKTQQEKNVIYKEMEELKKIGKDLTPEANLLKLKRDSLTTEITTFKYNYIDKHVNIFGYYQMLYDAQATGKTNRQISENVRSRYLTFKRAFPDHPYSEVLKNVINGMVSIVPGNDYIDFSAPTLEGKAYKLSEQIQNKVALIDLWASWCGPCIAKSQAIVPVYQKYKDQGFTIVGVAREFKNLDAWKNRLKQEKFNWLQLIELDDKNGIWNKYAVGDGGGMQVLVDETGKVLQINPSPKEVEAAIKNWLKI